MPIGLLNKLISTARRVAFYLKEKPTLTIDDHVLEHMIFYHGLTGSRQENEKSTNIVKADIKEALARQNSAELSLALKLPPVLWKDGLENIIAAFERDKQQLLIRMLLPMDEDGNLLLKSDNKSFAVIHEDWQIRANAANILALLKAKEAVPLLTESLNSDTADSALSFCYVAYALGKLKGQEAKEALEIQLLNSDPWLRVDVAGALSYFEFDIVAQPLAKVLMQEQEALDYLAYAISRRHKPQDFLQSNSLEIIKAGGLMVLGIIEAAENSFTSDLVIETESHLCLSLLTELAQKEADPILTDAAINLCDWLISKKDLLKNLAVNNVDYSTSNFEEPLKEYQNTLTGIISNNVLKEKILNVLKIANSDPTKIEVADLIHAIKLAGRLDMDESQPLLFALLDLYKLDLEQALLIYIIKALGQSSINREYISSRLIEYSKELINIEDRCQRKKSKQPVFEEHTIEAKIYWHILKTLAHLTTQNSVAFLAQALKDYAPDKRSCALESLMAIYEKNPNIKSLESIDQILQDALKDPAPMMQLAALVSIAKLNRFGLIEDILPLIDIQENTVSKQALSVLDQISEADERTNLKVLLAEKYKTIKEEHKRKRIKDILQKE